MPTGPVARRWGIKTIGARLDEAAERWPERKPNCRPALTSISESRCPGNVTMPTVHKVYPYSQPSGKAVMEETVQKLR